MRTAIISDIHSNIDALNDVADDIHNQRCDSIVCLGDIVGYGYAPCECIDKMMDLHCTSILTGNHDAAVVGKLNLNWFNKVSKAGVLRDREKIDKDRKLILNNLTLQVEINEKNSGGRKVVFTHGDIDGGYNFPYIDDIYSAAATSTKMAARGVDILFVGHTHCAVCHYTRPSVRDRTLIDVADVIEYGTIDLDGMSHVIANVGSVGYPRNQPFSVYAIYDNDAMTIEWRKLRFDFNGYCKKMTDAGIPIPSWMHRWVEVGLVDKELANVFI